MPFLLLDSVKVKFLLLFSVAFYQCEFDIDNPAFLSFVTEINKIYNNDTKQTLYKSIRIFIDFLG